MNAIMNMVGAKSYINSFKRFAESELVQIEDDKLIRIKMDIEYTDKDEELFTVDDIYNPYVYLVAYQTGDPLVKCVICGKDFIKESNNQKTCSKKCSDELHKFRVEENNEKNRPAATQTKKEI
jgi:predicted nucleic acid-binding Zn ribbon protein